MDGLAFSELSQSEREEFRDAARQIAEAERRLAELLVNHLGLKNIDTREGDCAVYRYPTELSGNSLEVIRVGGKVVGVYVDPPGVCAPV